MVETSGYGSPRTNQKPGSVHRRDSRRLVCGSTGRRCHRRPTLRLMEKAPSPSQPLNSSTKCRGAGYGPCMDQRGVDDTVVPHLDNWRKPLACTVSNQDDGVHDEGGAVRRLTNGPSIAVSSVRVEFPA